MDGNHDESVQCGMWWVRCQEFSSPNVDPSLAVIIYYLSFSTHAKWVVYPISHLLKSTQLCKKLFEIVILGALLITLTENYGPCIARDPFSFTWNRFDFSLWTLRCSIQYIRLLQLEDSTCLTKIWLCDVVIAVGRFVENMELPELQPHGFGDIAVLYSSFEFFL